MERTAVRSSVHELWRREVIPALERYVAIPALSPAFDSGWEGHGHVRAAATLLRDWAVQLDVAGASVRVHELAHTTPVIVVSVDPYGPCGIDDLDASQRQCGTVLMYGHLDKQPEMDGWLDGLSAWTPVVADGKLYGRGGADDGYALFASLSAIRSLQRSGGSHGRIVLIIEGSEESGSPDLPAHIDALTAAIGDVDLVVCLDSGCATYDRLWTTTSLRGLAQVRFTVKVLTEGVHSGMAGGVVPSSFRIARLLLDRLEDASTGQLRLPELNVPIPSATQASAMDTAELLGPDWAERNYPWIASTCGHAANATTSTQEHLLDRTWRAAFEVIGADGLPATANAGNVLRPSTTLSLALRLAPTTDTDAAVAAVVRALTTDVPYGATVEIDTDCAAGWAAPQPDPWLASALDNASHIAWGKGQRSMGEGGSIPFMGMLATRFPQAQFAVAGVLGPGSNAHGPNEFLHLDYAERLTEAVAHLLQSHAEARTAAAHPGGQTVSP